METAHITGPEELDALAQRALGVVGGDGRASVIALHGELGAGKTAFVQALAHTLGVAQLVPSPTFVIMRRYATAPHPHFDALVHIDAYRVESLEELRVIRFAELLCEPRNLVCVEWAERVADAIPRDALHLSFSILEEDEGGTARRVTFSYGEEKR